ncbi:MAG: DUF4199 domain-containing protein [Bacteroidota bacterium]
MKENLVKKVGVKWGVLYAAFSIVFSLISLQFLNPAEPGAASYAVSILSFVAMIAAAVLAMKEYKRLNHDSMTLGQGFKTGLLMFAISGVIGSIFNFVYYKWIDPELSDKMIQAQLAQMESNPGMNEEAMEFMENILEFFLSPGSLLVTGIITALAFGALVSVIVAAILKKDTAVGFQEGVIDEIGQ